MSSLKRKRNTVAASTPSKVRRIEADYTASPLSGRRSARPKAPVVAPNASDGQDSDEITLATPTKPGKLKDDSTPKGRVNTLSTRTADRSAKRKSVHKLIQQEEASDEDDELGESSLAQRILEDDEDEDGDEPGSSDEEAQEPTQDQPKDLALNHDQDSEATPSKRPRGRLKSTAKRRERTPSPPRRLSSHEQYFFQNRPGAQKTSNSTLSTTTLLTHAQYHDAITSFQDPHQPEIDFLHAMHAQNYPQWLWEMQCGFSVGLYGWGSKRTVVKDFAEFVANDLDSGGEVVVVNGHVEGVGFKDVLSALAGTIRSLCDKSGAVEKLPANASDALNIVLEALSSGPDNTSSEDPSPERFLFINSLDAPLLRRPPAPTLLSRLAAHPRIALLATFNQPNFPLLWDSPTRTAYNWAFHDTTTFAPLDAEVPDVVDVMNGLLGRSGRRVQGREGVVYVLRSLTGSARRLFALVCGECLGAGESEAHGGDAVGAAFGERENDGEDDDEDDEDDEDGRASDRRKKKSKSVARAAGLGGVEYRALYRKAVQALIATSEVQFRQLLKEFFDHEMLVSERSADGTEVLGLPFRREECEEILGELVTDE